MRLPSGVQPSAPSPGRMPRKSPRHAARGGHDEDVDVAVVLAGEGDRGAVGRKLRIGFDAGAGGQPPRLAACARHAPEVAGIGEDDGGGAQGWPLDEIVRIGRGAREKESEEKGGLEKPHILLIIPPGDKCLSTGFAFGGLPPAELRRFVAVLAS